MKKSYILLMCLLAILAARTSLKAQEITITLSPGWNWISYPNAVTMEINEALGSFVPVQGDLLKAKNGNSATFNGTSWRGGLTHFMPGFGYMYYSARSEATSFVFANAYSTVVETATPTDITTTSAVVGGTVTVPEGGHVFLRGVCWGTEPSPDIDGNHTSDGTIAGSFSDTIEDLTTGLTYYLRAYAVSDNGLAYGNEMSFTTEASGSTPTGAINGKFTINDSGNQVYFSQGNLQYIGSASTPYWKFADNQWDVLGKTTGQNSNNQNVDRDLFGWGTSGYHDSNDPYNVNYQPWSTSSTTVNDIYNYFGYGPSINLPSPDLTGDFINYDWGVYNAISNGGNQAGLWRTLTKEEWVYLFNTRTTVSGIRFAKAQVNDVDGIILLPDNWNSGNYSLSNTNSFNVSFASNVLDASEWASLLESNGAVFLPAAGQRNQNYVSLTESSYWSASCNGAYFAYYVGFTDSYLWIDHSRSRCQGVSVRLVHRAMDDSYTISVTTNIAGAGEVTGGGDYQLGTECTLTAIANEGYSFLYWTENDWVISEETSYTFTVSGNRTLVAVFAETDSGNGILNGEFTINVQGEKVNFSKGNLQYQAATNTWKFAENQWDYVGSANSNTTPTYSGWIDLFGWGTSGWNSGANCYQPWSISESYSDYCPGGSIFNDLTGYYANSDWGVYNAISNGGNLAGLWRTLTKQEWVYLFNTRATAIGIRYAKAQVCGVNGVILLPDDWSSNLFYLSNVNTSNASYGSNVINSSEWMRILEPNGAVFLPAAGYRNWPFIDEVGIVGVYWSVSQYSEYSAYSVGFWDNNLEPDHGCGRDNGASVRLVRSAQ